MLMTLEQAKENPLGCEEFQLKNWLSQLDEYLKRHRGIVYCLVRRKNSED